MQPKWALILTLLSCLSMSACRTAASDPRSIVQSEAGQSILITEGRAFYFKAGDSQRDQSFAVQMPADVSTFEGVTLDFNLDCPEGRCEIWDRFGSMGLIDETGRYLELFRFMTPYGIGARWSIDLSPFLPLLEKEKTFRISIDTWAAPGSPQGNGWLVSAKLRYLKDEGSTPGIRPFQVIPVLSKSRVLYGDPKAVTLREVELAPLPNFKTAKLVSLITGHGQGNAENCAEFCPKTHSFRLGGQDFKKRVWRDDCATTVDPAQKGYYQFPRAGWCPGDKVNPWILDVSEALRAKPRKITYNVEAYTNGCRPDAAPCTTCIFKTSCDYDGGEHTEPYYYVTSYLVLYR